MPRTAAQLPEPIVREIASGTSRIAHRYENVTVLQADMVGFTPLSAARGPEEVLGILSELFADFDQAVRLRLRRTRGVDASGADWRRRPAIAMPA